MKNLIIIMATILTTTANASVDKIDKNVVLVDFKLTKGVMTGCVEQISKAGEVVFPGAITRDEYNNNYSGFWFKGSGTCAFYKKKA